MLLLTVVVLWVALVALVTLHRSLPVAWKGALGALLLAYGVTCAVTLAASYRANVLLLAEYSDRRQEAAGHMERIYGERPDSLRLRPFVLAAERLRDRLDKVAASYGPGTWPVSWRYGLFPAFQAGGVAENLLTLVKVPPLMLYDQARWDQHVHELSACYDARSADFPMGMSATVAFVDHLLQLDAAMQNKAIGLIDSVDIVRDLLDEPRSGVSVLADIPHRMVGVQGKIEAVLEIGCGGFDEVKIMKMARSSAMSGEDVGLWRPCSPLFSDMEYLSAIFVGVNSLEARWMGDPPRPVIGSVDAIYRIECETIGHWPASEETWTDGESGRTGPTYVVDVRAYQYCKPGLVITKWGKQPDLRVGEAARTIGRGFTGIPTTLVPKPLLYPLGYTGPRL